MAATHELTVQQYNYQNSLNADSADEDLKINAMAAEGWEVVTADVSGWPYVTVLWRRALPAGRKQKLSEGGYDV